MHLKLSSYLCGALFAVAALTAVQISAQSPIPNPPVHREKPAMSEVADKDRKVSEVVDKDQTVAMNDAESIPEKRIVDVAFSGKRFGVENEKSLTKPDPAAVFGTASEKKNAAQPDDDDWEFSFSPYIWAPSIDGTIGARGRSFDLSQDPDGDFGGIFDYLDFALAGTFEARKGRILIGTDFQSIRFSGNRDTPGRLFNNVKVGFNYLLFQPEVGYRALESSAGSLDVLGGVRIWSVENTLTVTAGTQPGFGAAQRKTWVAFIAGARGTVNLAPWFFLTGRLDVGAGSGTSSTSQAFGAAGFRLARWISLLGGYRYLQVDHDDESGFIFDTQMKGFIVGAKFTF